LNGTRSDRVQQLAQTLERAGIRTEVSEDIDAALWEKFASVPLFGMGAVTRVQLGVWRSIPAVHKLLKDATLEVLAVARARGVSLRDGLFELMMRVTDELLPEHWMASMQVDIMEGRPSELDAQTGAVVRLGAEAGVPTPVNEFIYYSLLPQEMKARGQV
jgi:2-dehydropantoate 2-reductase